MPSLSSGKASRLTSYGCHNAAYFVATFDHGLRLPETCSALARGTFCSVRASLQKKSSVQPSPSTFHSDPSSYQPYLHASMMEIGWVS
eukprot:scaffold18330_cov72-Phaeocystis_antarctica.AAC.2